MHVHERHALGQLLAAPRRAAARGSARRRCGGTRPPAAPGTPCGSSRATTENAWPARIERAENSRLSGNCSSNLRSRRAALAHDVEQRQRPASSRPGTSGKLAVDRRGRTRPPRTRPETAPAQPCSRRATLHFSPACSSSVLQLPVAGRAARSRRRTNLPVCRSSVWISAGACRPAFLRLAHAGQPRLHAVRGPPSGGRATTSTRSPGRRAQHVTRNTANRIMVDTPGLSSDLHHLIEQVRAEPDARGQQFFVELGPDAGGGEAARAPCPPATGRAFRTRRCPAA